MMKKSRVFALMLIVLMIIQSLGAISFAATDLSGHWAEAKMTEWIRLGYIKGYPDGTVRPDNRITRAEFMAIVNKAFALTGSRAISYTDVKSSDWYYSVISMAVANGYIGGYPDGTMRPNAPISRAEAAVIITKVTQLTLDPTTANYYNDRALIPTWSLGAVGAVSKAGIMSGYTGGLFGAQRSITRAETVAALSKALLAQAVGTQIYSVAGTFGPSTGTQLVQGDVKITAASVNLRNMTITGSVLIDKSVGNGNVSLSNVTVQGQIYVNGGGVNSVVMENVKSSTLYAARAEGMVRIVATGTTKFDTTYIQGDVRLEEAALSGDGFAAVYVNTDAPSTVDLEFVNTKLDVLYLKAKSTKTTFDSKSSVTKLTVSGSSNTINTVTGTTISTFVADSAVTVTGAGTITKAEVNASGVSFDIRPVTLTVKSGVSQPTITGSGIESWTPVKGATSVAIDSNIVIKFTDTVRLTSGNTALTNSNVDALINLRTKSSTGTKVPFDATVTTTSGKTVITIDPTSDLLLDQLYYVGVNFDVMEDVDNNSLLGDSSITFTTVADGVPTVQTFEPINGAANVSLEGNLKITFSEKVRLISGNTDLTNSNVDAVIVLKRTNSSGANVAFDATVSTVSSKTVITINPDSNLLAGQVYYFAVKDDVLEDYSDIKLTGTKAATFTTITSAAPIVETYSPLNGAVNVSPTVNLTMTFNKEVRLLNDTALNNTNVDALVTLKETNSSGAAQTFDATVTVTSGKTVITVDPSATLKSNQVYYLAITGLEDSLNQALTGTVSITFTTLASGAPMLESFSPVTNGALDANVVITFTKEVRAVDDTVLSSANVAAKLGLVLKKDNSSGADIAFVPSVTTVSNKTVITLNPTPTLDSGSTYYVAFDNVEDLTGQAFIGAKFFTFTTLPIAVTGVTLTSDANATTITTLGGTLQMTATVLPANATDKTVTWSVIPGTGTATISNTGNNTALLTAVSNGTVTVRATSNSNNALNGQMTITLSNQAILPTSITVSGAGSATTITSMGGTLQMQATVLPVNATNTSVVWSVSPGTGTATIDSSGVLTAVSNGTVTVTATSVSNNTVSGSTTITLSGQAIPVTSITISSTGNATTITSDDGELQLTASVLPVDATNASVTWSIQSGPTVATVTSGGLVKAVSNGTVVVRATSVSNGSVRGDFSILVSGQVVPVTGISVSGGSSVAVGGTLDFTATVTPSYATTKNVVWSVDAVGEAGATINGSGQLTATAAGNVIVKATATDGSGVVGQALVTITIP
jgi:uncharacterized protein YjdB